MSAYRDESPWDVLSRPARMAKLAGGDITQDTLIFALRSLGPSTPHRVAKELGVGIVYVARNLITLKDNGLATRIKTLVNSSGQNRASFTYSLVESSKAEISSAAG